MAASCEAGSLTCSKLPVPELMIDLSQGRALKCPGEAR
jgi:hypothetical protein